MTPETEAKVREWARVNEHSPDGPVHALLDALDAERHKVRELETVIDGEFGTSLEGEFDAFSAALDNPPKAGPELKRLMRSGEEWTADGLHRPTVETCAQRVAGTYDEYTDEDISTWIRALAEPQEKP